MPKVTNEHSPAAALNQRLREEPSDILERFIRQRLAAGDAPGKVALDLERVRPGLGRVLVADLNKSKRPMSEESREPPFGLRAQPLYGTAMGMDSPQPIGRQFALKPGDDKWGPTGLLDIGYRAKATAIRAHPEVKRNFERIITSIAGATFRPEELELITREIIDNINRADAAIFAKVAPEGGVLRLDKDQWKVVRNLLDGMPHDALGGRLRGAYEKAVREGRIQMKN